MVERELVAVFVALDEVEDQVSDVEGPTPHSTVVVPAQRLLVPIQLVHGILEECLGSLIVIRPNPWRSIVKVGQEDSLRTTDHEEW